MVNLTSDFFSQLDKTLNNFPFTWKFSEIALVEPIWKKRGNLQIHFTKSSECAFRIATKRILAWDCKKYQQGASVKLSLTSFNIISFSGGEFCP